MIAARAAIGLATVTILSAVSARAAEPVIGGPCEGCELVFSGMPDRIGPRARIAPIGEKGEPLVIEGVVRTIAGKPAADVIVYAYHTDATGIYPTGSTRHGRLRGWARTDLAGHYRFDTIRPGAYPSGDNPQHVHMHVIEPGKATYSIDEIVFDDDPLLTPSRRERAQSWRGGNCVAHPVKDDKGVWHVTRDITLGKNVPGYP
jgi:protocatechuate 3,4-dioxygenase beta subunit